MLLMSSSAAVRKLWAWMLPSCLSSPPPGEPPHRTRIPAERAAQVAQLGVALDASKLVQVVHLAAASWPCDSPQVWS